jgi:hypothetical protein
MTTDRLSDFTIATIFCLEKVASLTKGNVRILLAASPARVDTQFGEDGHSANLPSFNPRGVFLSFPVQPKPKIAITVHVIMIFK